MEEIKAVIYARYSSSGQREESIEGQIRECTAYAQKHGMTIVGEYSDHALTGRTDKRPDFQRMIKDSDKHLFDVVICWKMDRFARNRYDSATYKHRLKKNGVKVVYAMEYVPEGPEGIILESVMEGYAEYYSENLAQNIRRGYYENALAGKVLTSPPFGYIKDENGMFAVDPGASVIVKRIYSEYLSGKGSRQIAEDLNAEGWRNAKGRPFGLNTIRYILTNKKYTGHYEYRDIILEDVIPPLISKEDFEAAQRMLNRKKEAPAAKMAVYALTGKLYCGKCGDTVAGEYGTSRNGSQYFYYTCHNRKSFKACKLKRQRRDYIEDLIADELIKLVFDDDFIDEVADLVVEFEKKEEASGLLPVYEARRAEIARQVNNITNALALAPTSAALVSKLTELEAQLKETDTAIARESIITPSLTKDQIVYFFEMQRKGDVNSPEFRRSIIDTFMQSAYLYDDHIVINLNYSGTKTPISKALIDDLESDHSPVRVSPVKSRLYCQTRTLPVVLVTLKIAA